jgi:acetyl-CoA carboxylase biotin carboxyl carrier protein
LETDKIRELIQMMVAGELTELSLRDGDVEINLRRQGAALPVQNSPGLATTTVHQLPSPGPEFLKGEVVEVEFHEIRSPMVGTFYASPDPESAPFVQVGSHVGPSTVVCILEAMKVFSEIKAETSGVIERILVRDGQAVEYGQPLFLVRPA